MKILLAIAVNAGVLSAHYILTGGEHWDFSSNIAGVIQGAITMGVMMYYEP